MKNKIKMRGVIVLDLEGTFNEIADVNRELEKFAENIGQDPVTINCVAGVKNRKGDLGDRGSRLCGI